MRPAVSSVYRWRAPYTFIYGTGPWTGDNICTALECFFQSNAYHPQATCDKCGHSGSVPLSLRVDSAPTVQSIPARTSVEPMREEELGHSAALDTSSEAELVKRPCTGAQTVLILRGVGHRGARNGIPIGRWSGAEGHRLSPPCSQTSESTNRAFL
jgi:hypothetical protein